MLLLVIVLAKLILILVLVLLLWLSGGLSRCGRLSSILLFASHFACSFSQALCLGLQFVSTFLNPLSLCNELFLRHFGFGCGPLRPLGILAISCLCVFSSSLRLGILSLRILSALLGIFRRSFFVGSSPLGIGCFRFRGGRRCLGLLRSFFGSHFLVLLCVHLISHLFLVSLADASRLRIGRLGSDGLLDLRTLLCNGALGLFHFAFVGAELLLGLAHCFLGIPLAFLGSLQFMLAVGDFAQVFAQLVGSILSLGVGLLLFLLILSGLSLRILRLLFVLLGSSSLGVGLLCSTLLGGCLFLGSCSLFLISSCCSPGLLCLFILGSIFFSLCLLLVLLGFLLGLFHSLYRRLCLRRIFLSFLLLRFRCLRRGLDGRRRSVLVDEFIDVVQIVLIVHGERDNHVVVHDSCALKTATNKHAANTSARDISS